MAMPLLLRRRGVIAARQVTPGAAFAVGSFTKATSTGLQSIDNLGFQPKAIIFWTSGSTAVSGSWDGDIHQAIGFTSGPNESFSVAGASEDAVGTSNTAGEIASKALTIRNPGNSASDQADLDSFDADGFTLDWTAQDVALGCEVMFLAIGGSDVEAKAVNWQSPSSTGNHGVTGVGFEPEVALHAVVAGMTAMDAFVGRLSHGFGAMDGTGQWTNAVFSQDNQSTSNTDRYQRTDKCVAHLLSGSVREEAEFVSFDVDGFTVNFTTASSAAIHHISLCLRGVSAKVGSFTSPPIASPQEITEVGFKPEAILFTNIEIAGSSPTTHNAIGMGATVDGGLQRSTAQRDRTSVSTTQARSVWRDDFAILSPRTTSDNFGDRGSVSSYDPDGFSINWFVSDLIEHLYVALGASS